MREPFFDRLCREAFGPRLKTLAELKLFVFDKGLKLVFWGMLIVGILQLATGIYEGPHFDASRIVTVERIATWEASSRDTLGRIGSGSGSTYWVIDYLYNPPNGKPTQGRIKITDYQEATDQIRDAQPGTEVLLRIPVDGSESGARLGVNQQVRQGGFTLLMWLILWFFFKRYRVPEFGGDLPAPLAAPKYWMQMLLCLFGAGFLWLWLTSPVVG
jgi:hypothetical protein